MFPSACLWRCSLWSGFKQAFPIYTFNLYMAVPCCLHPKTLGQERGRTSHFTIWTTWVILWHVCFKTPSIYLPSQSIPRLSWVRSMERWPACKGATCDPVSKKIFPIWVAVKTSVNSWDHPTLEISLRFCLRWELRKKRLWSAIRIQKRKGIAFEFPIALQGFGISWPATWWIKH